MEPICRATISERLTISGIGVHSGKGVAIDLHPLLDETGIWFQQGSLKTKADYRCVDITPMATVLKDANGIHISTIEHLMAALYMFGITDILIDVKGEEIPILDGSSFEISNIILKTVNIKSKNDIMPSIEILKPIEVRYESGNGYARLNPCNERIFTFSCDDVWPFSKYAKNLTISLRADDRDQWFNKTSRARTFGLLSDAERLNKAGLALGSSLENTLVFDDAGPINEGGFCFEDEHLHHKVLDAIGDLSLFDSLIYGHFEGLNSGHALNNKLLHEISVQTDAWRPMVFSGTM